MPILAQENGFGSAWLPCLRWLVSGTATVAVHLQKKSVINMIWLLVSVSDWPIILIRPGGLLLVVPHLFAVPVSVLSMGLQKSKYLYKLGCEEYFCRVVYWAPLEMLSVWRKQHELILGIIESREFLEIQYNTLDLLLCFSWSSQYMHFTPLPPALTDQN
jgi:hypothetical protein